MLRSRLTWKLFACFVGTIVLSTIGLSISAAVESERRAVTTVEYHLEVEVRFLQKLAVKPLTAASEESWRENFDVLKNEAPLRMIIYRLDGTIVADSADDEDMLEPLTLNASVKSITHDNIAYEMRKDSKGHRIVSAAVPVIENGALLGYAQSTLPLADFDAASIVFSSALISSAILISVVSLIPGVWLIYRIIRPIGVITQWARLLAAGEDATLPMFPPGEMGTLALALSEMHRSQMRSITETKNIKNRQSIILSASHDAIITTDCDGRILDFNPTAEKIFGISLKSAVGRIATELIVPEHLRDNPESPWRLKAALSSADAYNCRTDSLAMRADGTIFPVELAIVTTGTDVLNVCTIFIRDITKRRSAENSLREMNEQLEQRVATRTRELEDARNAADCANEAKSRFLAAVSHDLRTPMTAILGYTDLLTSSRLSDAERQRCVQTIHRTGVHLLTLLNDLLDFAKIESGKMIVDHCEASPASIIYDVVTLMRVKAGEKGISLEVDFSRPLPEMIKTDPTRLRQILMNLVGNAVKFTDSGSVRVSAYLDSIPADTGGSAHLIVEISDTGIGIAPDYFDKLFVPFVQGKQHHRGGTGLGLALCKAFAEMLGGGITARNNPERGSTFVLSIDTGSLEGIPITAPGSDWRPEPQDIVNLDTYPRLKGRVLVAEDSPDIQWLIEYLFQNMGVEITMVNNGHLAVEALLAEQSGLQPFDLVMLDMQMPVLNGYQAAEAMRQNGYTGPIIAMTAAVDPVGCMRAGCTAFLAKPLDKRHFIHTVAEILPSAEQEEIAPESEAPAAKEPDPDFQRFLPRYLTYLAGQIATINVQLQQQDKVGLKKVLHQIKGSAAMYGFDILGLAAGRAESLLLDDSHEPAELDTAIEKVITLARRIDGYDRSLEQQPAANPAS